MAFNEALMCSTCSSPLLDFRAYTLVLEALEKDLKECHRQTTGEDTPKKAD